jgi:hypothetical protein
MSFLKQAYALEQEVLEEVTDVDGDEFLDTVEQASNARFEAETINEEVERAIAVHDEIENQNETLAQIVEEKGEITPEVAAMTEVARRTAAAGLGLNPEQEGQELVDAEGLESMVAGNAVASLETAKEQANSLWEKIKQLWNVFVEKVSEFWNWLVKLFDTYDRRCKALVEKLKYMDNNTFAERLENINTKLADEGAAAIKNEDVKSFMKNDITKFVQKGTLANIAATADQAFKILDNINNRIDQCSKKALTDKDGDFGKYLNELLEPEQGLNVGNTAHTFVLENGTVVYHYNPVLENFDAELSFSKDLLIKSLLNANKARASLRKYAETSFKRYKAAKAEVSNSNLAKDPVHSQTLKDILKARKSIFKGEMKVTQRLTEMLKAYVRLATAIVNTSE